MNRRFKRIISQFHGFQNEPARISRSMTHLRKFVIGITWQALLLLSVAQVSAFELDGGKWPTTETEFYVNITGAGTAASGISWNTAFIAAMDDWNNATPFNFVLRNENRDPCANDSVNGVGFSFDVCGTAFGEGTLAVAILSSNRRLLGGDSITEANIVINQDVDFNIFDGNLGQPGIPGVDFRRVALHELGHALGLGHEASNPSIMRPSVGNLDRLQADDIAGVEKLYDDRINCVVQELHFGLIRNSLDTGDCIVNDLLPGGGDTSHIDLYRFELAHMTTLNLSMSSASLDSILLLADPNLQILHFDDKSGDVCDSALTLDLSPGSYVLMANTYDVQVKEECGTTGEYQINSSFSSIGLNSLGSAVSLSGAAINASFSGGISANNGVSFGNQFNPEVSLDVSARITIDPQHQGQAGFLVVAAVIDQQILFLNEQGEFVDSAAKPGVIERAFNKTLGAVEDITVVERLIPASLGISQISVDFYFGYGIASNPDELYFHQVPLNLTVAP